MSVVNTNVKSLFAQNSLKVNERSLTRAMEQLSTGKRISSAKDDAAGLAIGTKMTSDLRGMSMAIRNANDGISMMQTAEGALGEITNMLQRMRELAVQSSTGSLTAVNRASLQTEMDQLVAEIDNIARTSNFNGIKLLDGSAQSVSLQTGVNEGDQVTVGIAAASSKDLGLQGYRIEGEVTSGRVGALATLAADDVLINGKNAFATVPAAATAQALATAINSNVGQHRATATAFNTLKGAAPTDSSFASGDITINGDTIGAASSVEELVANINRDAAGVTATLAKDGSIELSNDTGADIVISGTSATTIAKAGFVGTISVKGAVPTASPFNAGDLKINGTDIDAAASVADLVDKINAETATTGVSATLSDNGTIELSNATATGTDIVIAGTDPSKAGFFAGTTSAGKTYSGYVTLSSLDGEDISIKARSAANGYSGGAGSVGDIQAMGFNEAVEGSAYTGVAVGTSAITLEDDLRINGVPVGPSADSSALSKAAAINALSAQTGVTASAKTEVRLTYDIGELDGAADVTINGKLITLSGQTDIAGIVTEINGAGVNGIAASTDQDGNLILSSESGADIMVTDDATSFFTGMTSLSGEIAAGSGTTASPYVVKGRISLSSDTGADVRVESNSPGAAALIGFADQGGSDTLVGGALSISTQDAAGRAISAIDAAIEAVSVNRSTLGAFQNRLVAAVDNLATTSTNLAESRSRIMDADYAATTTELARSQIIQQAATAMLAQANQSSQSVLSLLQQ